MRFRISHIALLVGTSLMISCFSGRKGVVDDGDMNNQIRETQYYRIFTDATKHALFGNNKTAVALYEACIEEFPDRAASYYQLSTIYRRLNDFDKAIVYANNAIERDSTNVWYRKHLGAIYQNVNKIDSAIWVYEGLMDVGYESDEMRYILSNLYTQIDSNRKALSLLEGMSTDKLGSIEIMLMRHNAFHKMNEYDSAVTILESIISLYPDDVNNYGMLAEYLTEIGRASYAKRVYRDILKTDPGNGLALLSFADHYLNENKPDSAFVYYKQAYCCSDLTESDKISIIISFLRNPDFLNKNEEFIHELMEEIDKDDRDYSFYAAKADVYINLEKYALAKPYMDSALIFEKNNYRIWEQTLLINSFLNNDLELVRICTEALEYFKDKPNLYLIRANSFNKLGSYDLAIKDLEFVSKLENLEEMLLLQSYVLLAEIYRELKDYEKSDFYFDELLKIDENNLMVRNNYAYYLSLREEKLELAEKLSKLTIEMEPLNPTYLDTYGWILYKLQRYNEAKKYIEASIKNGSYTNVEVLEHYGDVMLKLDRCDEAIEAYEAILDIEKTEAISLKISEVSSGCK